MKLEISVFEWMLVLLQNTITLVITHRPETNKKSFHGSERNEHGALEDGGGTPWQGWPGFQKNQRVPTVNCLLCRELKWSVPNCLSRTWAPTRPKISRWEKYWTFLKLSSSGDDQPWFGGGGWTGKPWTDQLGLLSHQVKQLTAKSVDSKTLI